MVRVKERDGTGSDQSRDLTLLPAVNIWGGGGGVSLLSQTPGTRGHRETIMKQEMETLSCYWFTAPQIFQG